MKNCITILLVMLGFVAQAQIQTPQPSSAGSATSVVGLTEIKVDYSRPKLKGRKIFGEGAEYLVPFGQLWRTGANNGTIVKFADDVTVEGNAVPKGDYLLLTWPGAAEWTVVLYKDLSMGGNTAAYDQSKDQARFKVKPGKLTEKVETLTMGISDIADDNSSANIQISWENTSVKFKVGVEFDTRVMKAIDANTKVNPGNLVTAAHYYFDTNKDLNQALKWVNEYLATGKNSEQFWNVHFKAQIQKALGDKAGATASAKQSLELAKKAPSDFGYVKLNEDLLKTIK